jgi:hypothetical protein
MLCQLSVAFRPLLWIRISIHFGRLDPDQHWERGSGSRRAKITHKSEEIQVLKCRMFSFEE